MTPTLPFITYHLSKQLILKIIIIKIIIPLLTFQYIQVNWYSSLISIKNHHRQTGCLLHTVIANSTHSDCLQHTQWLLTAQWKLKAHSHRLQHTVIAYSTHWLLTAHTDCLRHTVTAYITKWLLIPHSNCLQHRRIAYSTEWLLTVHTNCSQQIRWLLTSHTHCLQHTWIHCEKVCHTDKLIDYLEHFAVFLIKGTVPKYSELIINIFYVR